MEVGGAKIRHRNLTLPHDPQHAGSHTLAAGWHPVAAWGQRPQFPRVERREGERPVRHGAVEGGNNARVVLCPRPLPHASDRMHQNSKSVVGKSLVVGYASPFIGGVEEKRMACPYCQGDATQELERATALGYRLFRCRPCRRTFNERTGTPFNHLQVPTDVALLVVLWLLRYKLSLRDRVEMFLTRGFTFTHETGSSAGSVKEGHYPPAASS